MTPQRIFDAVMLVAVGLASVGAGLQWGAPVGMMTAGGLTIVVGFAEMYLLA